MVNQRMNSFAYEPFSHSNVSEKTFNLGDSNPGGSSHSIHASQFYSTATGDYTYGLLHGANVFQNELVFGKIGMAIYENTNTAGTSVPGGAVSQPGIFLGGGARIIEEDNAIKLAIAIP